MLFSFQPWGSWKGIILWYVLLSHPWKGEKWLHSSLLKNKQQRIKISGLFCIGKEAVGDTLKKGSCNEAITVMIYTITLAWALQFTVHRVLTVYGLHAPSSGILWKYTALYFSYTSVTLQLQHIQWHKKAWRWLSLNQARFSIVFLFSKHLQRILLDFISNKGKNY